MESTYASMAASVLLLMPTRPSTDVIVTRLPSWSPDASVSTRQLLSADQMDLAAFASTTESVMEASAIAVRCTLESKSSPW